MASEEKAGVAVHGCLVGGDGAVELPHDDGLGMVEEIVPHAGNIFDDGDGERLKIWGRTDTGK